MVAPLLFWILRRKKWLGAASLIGFVGLVYCFESQLTLINRSFHLGNVFHFITGIASYYLWKHLPENLQRRHWQAAFWLALAGGLALLNLPYKIWFCTMALILYPRFHANSLPVLEWAKRVLNSKPLQFLGRTSYVTYLLHWIVIELVLFWLVNSFPDWRPSRLLLAIICTVAVYPITYLISDLVHRYLEIPCIKIPKIWRQAPAAGSTKQPVV